MRIMFAAAAMAASLVSLPLLAAPADERIPITPNPLDVSPGVTVTEMRDAFLSAGPDVGLAVFAIGMDCSEAQVFDGLRIVAVAPNVLRVRAASRNGVRQFYDGPVMVGQVIHVPVRDFVWTGFARDGDDNPTAVRARAVCRPAGP